LLEVITVDLALVDLSLPRMSGIDLVQRLQQENSRLPCLMLSGHLDSLYVRRSLHAGARGYVLKGDSEAILEGIRKVMKGEIYLSPELR
jgi:DNA-binding NarL/FixJ family response regulator